MATDTKLLTAEGLFALPDGDRRCELIDGRIVELTPPGGEHNRLMGRLTIRLGVHVLERQLGEVLPGDTGVIIRRNPDTVRAPGLCFLSNETVAKLPDGRVPAGYLEVVPDFIIEIVSPSDRADEVQAKTEEWLSAGARLVWTVYPRTHTVVSSTPGGTERVYRAGDTLTGAPVVPEFTVPVSDIFPT